MRGRCNVAGLCRDPCFEGWAVCECTVYGPKVCVCVKGGGGVFGTGGRYSVL